MFTGGQTVRFYSSAASAASFYDPAGAQVPASNCDDSGLSLERHDLFRHYPGLGDLWSAQLDRWQRATLNLLAAAHTFAEATYAGSVEGCLEGIESDLSDPHDGNECVTLMRFRGRESWFYKPRSGERERLFAMLLDHVSEAGFPLQYISPEVVSAGAAHWSREVEHSPCVTSSDVEHFFYRAGGLLYVLHLFRAVDLHAANLVARGAYPVVVDCETLLHPDGRLPERFAAEDESLVRTGMLPTGAHAASGGSGLGTAESGRHLPLLHGRVQQAADFVPQITDGFREMHRVVCDVGLRGATLRALAAELKSTPTRFILRRSIEYYGILIRSFEPLHLQSRAARQLFLAQACDSGRITAVERRFETTALARADIPRLMTKACEPREISDIEVAAAVELVRSSLAGGGST